mmetsp:Transcript_32861/g.86034  ORF Transcript_32861/g.86034 Transcript_32861/m.86034 type:complete len:125 (+) Transcript_32861:1021-1395(+)
MRPLSHFRCVKFFVDVDEALPLRGVGSIDSDLRLLVVDALPVGSWLLPRVGPIDSDLFLLVPFGLAPSLRPRLGSTDDDRCLLPPDPFPLDFAPLALLSSALNTFEANWRVVMASGMECFPGAT